MSTITDYLRQDYLEKSVPDNKMKFEIDPKALPILLAGVAFTVVVLIRKRKRKGKKK